MDLIADLDAFYLEHRRCGDLEYVTERDPLWVAMACSCGALIARWIIEPVDPTGRLQ
jgi:hypothetical protein